MTQSPATPLPSVKDRRALRESKELTQDQVAAELGVTRTTVRRWETGRTTPRGQHREAYARLLTSPETDSAAPSEAAASQATAAPTATATTVATSPADDDITPPRLTPDQAFDALYAFTAPGLVRQAYLLTGRRALAREAVEQAFFRAWEQWPEVAVDPDPVGWVRAQAYEFALSPWHRLLRCYRAADAPPAEPEDRRLLAALLGLPSSYRRTLVLYDGVGLDLPETAAETEASTPAAANRLLHAREAVAEELPELVDPGVLHRRLGELAAAERLGAAAKPAVVRLRSEHRTRFWIQAAIAFTMLIIGASLVSLVTAPTGYEPERAPGEPVSGVPPRMGPGKLSEQDRELRKQLKSEPANGPGRIVPFAE